MNEITFYVERVPVTQANISTHTQVLITVFKNLCKQSENTATCFEEHVWNLDCMATRLD